MWKIKSEMKQIKKNKKIIRNDWHEMSHSLLLSHGATKYRKKGEHERNKENNGRH